MKISLHGGPGHGRELELPGVYVGPKHIKVPVMSLADHEILRHLDPELSEDMIAAATYVLADGRDRRGRMVYCFLDMPRHCMHCGQWIGNGYGNSDLAWLQHYRACSGADAEA